MSRWIDADALKAEIKMDIVDDGLTERMVFYRINEAPSIDIIRCKECRKSHIDGKTTHYLWCTEWGRSTDVFGFCERGEREGE